MDIIRASLNEVTGSDTAFMSYTGTGRAGEGVAGKVFQHYGFRSVPPAETDLVTIQQGNNVYSVAENAKPGPFSSSFGALETGTVLVYAGANTFIRLNPGTDKLQISSNGDVEIITNTLNDTTITTKKCTIKTTGLPQSLMTETYSLALEAWFTANAAALTAVGVTAFIAPLGGLTSTLEAE